jgi:PAS domain S-box-containing protein
MDKSNRFEAIKRSSVAIGFLLLLAALVANALLTRRQLGLQVASQTKLRHSLEILLQLSKTEDLLQDAETSQRGYLYTGDSRYLFPYSQAMSHVDVQMAALAQLTADDPSVRDKMPVLYTLERKKLAELQKTMELDRQGWISEAKALAAADPSLFMMRDIRTEMNAMQADERSLEAARSATYERNVDVTIAYIYLTNLVAAIGAILLAFHIHGEIFARERDAEKLRSRERELLESQKHSQLFIEHAPVAVAMFDVNMRYIYASKRWLSDYALGDQQIRGLRHYEVLPEISDKWRKLHQRALHGEVLRVEAERFERRDGSTQWIRWEMRPWEDATNKVGGIVIFSEEITERKRDEESLRLSEERLRLANEVADVGTFDVELPSGKQTWSQRFFELFGMSPNGSVPGSRAILNRVHPADRERVLNSMVVMRRGGSLDIQYRIMRPNGTIGWLEVRGRGIRDETGLPTRFLGIGYDVTERKRAEESLNRSENQMRALASRLQSVAETERLRISRELHDQLGQALTGIKMDLNWIVRKHSTPEAPWAPLIVESMRAIEATVATVRNLSSELRPQLLDTLGLRAAIEWDCEQFERRTGIVCSVLAAEEPLRITEDQSIAIFRIFQEALTNIARHAHANFVAVSIGKSEEQITVTIQDDGIGFSLDVLEHQHSLGFVGMRERAALIGATFRLESSAGNGTTVTVGIPRLGPVLRVANV